ncbi:Serine/threonine-protein kinase PknB [Phycisphaerae bacterium RAS1]|nr:Serine/threonine-protein kinase PknB [Phycisphaerae bacterium RAS1]
MTSCLTDAEFNKLVAGIGARDDLARLKAHVDQCAACRQTLDRRAAAQPDSSGGARLAGMGIDATITSPGPLVDPSDVLAAPRPGPGSSAVHTGTMNWNHQAAAGDALSGPTGAVEPPDIGDEDFEMNDYVGGGGQASVFRARQRSLDRVVAIKVLDRPDLHGSPVHAARFEREARLAASLHHPNIVEVYKYGRRNRLAYYAMTFVNGPTFSSLIHDQFRESRPERMSPETLRSRCPGFRQDSYYRQIAEWMTQIADALHYAHERGLVHRDIKPANIMLDEDGRPYLTDFGLSKQLADPGVSLEGSFVGTMCYTSPEQLAGQEASPQTDIFSLGAALYELLTYERAFPGQHYADVARRIRDEDPPAPRTRVAEVPPELERICMCALQKDPSKRYANAQALAADLRCFLGATPKTGGDFSSGGPIAPAQPPPVTPMQTRRDASGAAPHPAAKRRAPAALIPLLLLVTAAGAWYAWDRWGPGGDTTGPKPPTPVVEQLPGLQVTPASLALTASGASQALTVRKVYSTGRLDEVVGKASGTTYEVSDANIVSVDDEGVVTARNSGSTTVLVRNSGQSATVPVHVDFAHVIPPYPAPVLLDDPQTLIVVFEDLDADPQTPALPGSLQTELRSLFEQSKDRRARLLAADAQLVHDLGHMKSEARRLQCDVLVFATATAQMTGPGAGAEANWFKWTRRVEMDIVDPSNGFSIGNMVITGAQIDEDPVKVTNGQQLPPEKFQPLLRAARDHAVKSINENWQNGRPRPSSSRAAAPPPVVVPPPDRAREQPRGAPAVAALDEATARASWDATQNAHVDLEWLLPGAQKNQTTKMGFVPKGFERSALPVGLLRDGLHFFTVRVGRRRDVNPVNVTHELVLPGYQFSITEMLQPGDYRFVAVDYLNGDARCVYNDWLTASDPRFGGLTGRHAAEIQVGWRDGSSPVDVDISLRSSTGVFRPFGHAASTRGFERLVVPAKQPLPDGVYELDLNVARTRAVAYCAFHYLVAVANYTFERQGQITSGASQKITLRLTNGVATLVQSTWQ